MFVELSPLISSLTGEIWQGCSVLMCYMSCIYLALPIACYIGCLVHIYCVLDLSAWYHHFWNTWCYFWLVIECSGPLSFTNSSHVFMHKMLMKPEPVPMLINCSLDGLHSLGLWKISKGDITQDCPHFNRICLFSCPTVPFTSHI